jgi:Vacuolar sorting protein 39 domain 2
MQESQHTLHEAQVKSSLLKTQHIRVKSDLMDLRNRSVTVTTNSRCAVCNKHIGDRVFAAYPTGTMVRSSPCVYILSRWLEWRVGSRWLGVVSDVESVQCLVR